MKVDIHNHILPKEWPDLKQVGNQRLKLTQELTFFYTYMYVVVLNKYTHYVN